MKREISTKYRSRMGGSYYLTSHAFPQSSTVSLRVNSDSSGVTVVPKHLVEMLVCRPVSPICQFVAVQGDDV